MIKYLVLLFNMLAFLVYQVIFTEGVTINQTVPATAKPGSEFTVELRINKGSIGGFAKLQQDLPEGFTATAIENSGGSFSFNNQSVKIIWASLPSQPELKVTYKVSVAGNASGKKTIAGKFSYVDAANQKQSVGVDEASIDISASEPEAKKEETQPSSGGGTTTTATDIKKEEESKAPQVQTITAARTMPTEVEGEFTVEITLGKGSISGYCKLQETLPEGFTAKAIDRDNSEFTFVNQVVKFVWVSVSAKQEQLKVSYKVTLDKKVSGAQTIEGLFSYIENDETKKYLLQSGNINIKAPAATSEPVATKEPENKTSGDSAKTTTTTTAATTTGSSGSSTETSSSSSSGTTTATTTGSSGSSTETSSSSTSTETKPVTNVPSANTNVNYRVQISATHQNVEVSYFTGKYGISEQIYAEMHEGWNKFTVGGFNEYKNARDHRENIRGKGVDGPFVTAYNSGRRITVQEALMITSQKWYR